MQQVKFNLGGHQPTWLLFGLLMLMIVAVYSCAGVRAGASSNLQQLSPTNLLPTATTTVKSTATFTETAIPTETATTPPATHTATPRPSHTIEPTPTAQPQPFVIGYSVAKRPLEVFHFGNGPQKRMIVAGIHGGYEWNTIALADQLIQYLSENPDIVPPNITLYVLRSANPDGEARVKGSGGRANENGVDINRNFPANWAREWDFRGCWNHLPITAGAYAGSEPETSAIMKFLLTNRIEALISYHSAALGIFAGGQSPASKSHDLAEILAATAPYTYPPPYDSGCQYTGQLADWAANHNIAAVDIELTNHDDTDYYINLEILAAFLAWERR